MNRSYPAPATKQRGIVLIAAILLLLVVTIMALSMFRSYGTQERIAGNTRDKQRALNAAVSAQQFAEYSLLSGATPSSAVCAAGFVSSNTGEVCTNALVNPVSLPWASGVIYTQFTSNAINNVANVINANTGSADVYTNNVLTQSASYYQAPAYYISDLGPNKDPSNQGELYQIDAVGYGGTANTVAVVESTYLISSTTARNTDK